MSKSDPRSRCPNCYRAQRTCICALARRVEHEVEVLILMHPMEVHEAKGTGHLLHLCLPHSRVMVGEQFDTAALQQALLGSWDGRPARQSLLLYPDTGEQAAALGFTQASALPQPWPLPPGQLRLVIIDGTWRKSRKMLYLNPALQTLPRLALKEAGDSGYTIRKAHLPAQLSSFEAAVLGIAQLQNWPQDAAAPSALSQVFKQFVNRQTQLRNENQAPTRAPARLD